MKKVIIAIVVLAVLGGAYWFFTKPNGTKCDCEVQSYYDANRNYCNDLSAQESTPQTLEEFYSKKNKSNCTHDFKTEFDSEHGYVKYDAIVGYDEDGLPAWQPVLLKDDGKYPANEHIEQIKKALAK